MRPPLLGRGGGECRPENLDKIAIAGFDVSDDVPRCSGGALVVSCGEAVRERDSAGRGRVGDVSDMAAVSAAAAMVR